MCEETELAQLWWCWARRLVVCAVGNYSSTYSFETARFRSTTHDIGVRFHSCSGPRVAVRLRWDTGDGTRVPKRVGFDTYRELYFIAVYGLHLLVNVSNIR
jgi:hypothetical protein